MYHRRFLGFGVQFCPECLAGDRFPFFRRRWRVAYCTFCPEHQIMLCDRCPHCGAPVAFHRRELGKPLVLDPGPMSMCHNCEFDLRNAPPMPILNSGKEGHAIMRAMLQSLEANHRQNLRFSLSFHRVLHQLCRVLASPRPGPRFSQFIESEVGLPTIPIERSRMPFEMHSLPERHHVLSLAFWVMADLRNRLSLAWKARAVRYNFLMKDLDHPPIRLVEITQRFNRNWKSHA